VAVAPRHLNDDTSGNGTNVKLEDYNWTSNLSFMTFTFRNDNAYAVKDIKVLCRYFAPSGTEIDSNRSTIYETVSANSSKTVRGFYMGSVDLQAKRAQCAVLSVNRA
jgi:hypothetical protein